MCKQIVVHLYNAITLANKIIHICITWMNLKNILLNESNRHKRLHILFHLYDILEIEKLYRRIIDQFLLFRVGEGRTVDYRRGGWGNVLEQWNCSECWVWWMTHEMCLSKSVDLYTTNRVYFLYIKKIYICILLHSH